MAPHSEQRFPLLSTAPAATGTLQAVIARRHGEYRFARTRCRCHDNRRLR